MSGKVIAALIGAVGTAIGVLGAAVIKFLAGSEDVAQQLATELRDDLAEDRDYWQERAHQLLDEREEMEARIDRLEERTEKLESYIENHPQIGDNPSDIIDDDDG